MVLKVQWLERLSATTGFRFPMKGLLYCPVPHLALRFFCAAMDIPDTAKMVTAGTAWLHFRHASQRPNGARTDQYLRGRDHFRDCGCHHHAIFQEGIDMLFHFSRKPGHRTQQLFAVRLEQDFFEHRKRHPAAGLSRPERTVVVKAYADGHGDSLRAISGPHEESVPEFGGGPRFSHH